MNKTRQIKILSIIALVLAITGMTLGFAAFATTLSISSSATVTPISEDFKINIYGVKDQQSLNEFLNNNYQFEDVYLSSTNGVALANNADSVVATINNSTHTISGLKALFDNKSGDVSYIFVIKNEGKYDAYFPTTKYMADIEKNYWQRDFSKVCTPSGDANLDLVNKACDGIWGTVFIWDITTEGGAKFTEEKYFKIPAGSTEYLVAHFEYNGPFADGPFNVEFDDIQLTFSTTKPGE